MLPVLMEKGSSRGISSLLRPNAASPPPASQAAAWGEEEEEEMKVQVFRPKIRGLLSALVLAEPRQKSHPVPASVFLSPDRSPDLGGRSRSRSCPWAGEN